LLAARLAAQVFHNQVTDKLMWPSCRHGQNAGIETIAVSAAFVAFRRSVK